MPQPRLADDVAEVEINGRMPVTQPKEVAMVRHEYIPSLPPAAVTGHILVRQLECSWRPTHRDVCGAVSLRINNQGRAHRRRSMASFKKDN
jgi:hypothetical protein